MKKGRYSLSIHITSLFLVLTTLIGVILIAISYRYSQDLLANSVNELSHENSQKLESAFRQKAAALFTTLDFIALSPVIENKKPPAKNKRWLATIDLVFKRNPSLAALFYAKPSGEMILMRPLRSDTERKHFAAPNNASLLLTRSQVPKGKKLGLGEQFFFDANFKRIGYKKSNDSQYDPRTRPWYANSKPDGEIHLTEPYPFYYLNTNGITLSKRSTNGKIVVGADFTLSALSKQIAIIGYSPRSKVALFDKSFQLLAHHQLAVDLSHSPSQIEASLEQSIFKPVLNRNSRQSLYEHVRRDGIEWSVSLTPVKLGNNVRLLLAEATPQEDLLTNLLMMRNNQVTVALSILALYCIVVWVVANRIAAPLQTLVKFTDNIARFDFQKTRYPRSRIKEVADLTSSIELMEHTLHDLLRLLRETASNQDFSLLAKTIARQSYLVTKAETIMLYSYDTQDKLFSVAANHSVIPFKIDINELLSSTAWSTAELSQGEVIHFHKTDNALSPYSDILYNSDLYLFPLLNKQGQLVGVLTLGYERAISDVQQDKHAFLKELLSFAEIAKENIDQMQQQKQMLKAFIELIASAIDTKSPYTGSHCQRIPELTKMLTQATQDDDLHFPQFGMSSQQWETLHLASWLHDCGKVTTPEYVIDKATKLETIYDRIHEIRMRFELIKMQEQRNYWKAIAEGADKDQLDDELVSKLQQLDDEFVFIAECNMGDKPMTDEDISKLEQISERTWTRTLDDQIGISWIEKARAGETSSLPSQERLLDDKTTHQVPWPQDMAPQDLWNEEFTLKPGEVKYDRGELYNLSVRRGTLNAEERFIINDHIIQTITMLKLLPYPEHLKNVPEIAGSHHERVDGKGYPRGLTGEQLSIPARIMAIADVFEALTSNDRPYKKAKSLTESIEIMTHMATSGHIDPKLYLIFLEQEVDQDYAEMFLDPEQMSEIDREGHIHKVKEYIKKKWS